MLFQAFLQWLYRLLNRRLPISHLLVLMLPSFVQAQVPVEPRAPGGWVLYTGEADLTEAQMLTQKLAQTQPNLLGGVVPSLVQSASDPLVSESLRIGLLKKTLVPGQTEACPVVPVSPEALLKEVADALEFVEPERAAPLLQATRRALGCSAVPLAPQLWVQFLLQSGVYELYSTETPAGQTPPPRSFEQLLALYPNYSLASGYPGKVITAFQEARQSLKTRLPVRVEIGSLEGLPLSLRINGVSVGGTGGVAGSGASSSKTGAIQLLPGPQLVQLEALDGSVVTGALVDLKPGQTPRWPQDLFQLASHSELLSRLKALTGEVQRADAFSDGPLLATLQAQMREQNAAWLLLFSPSQKGVRGTMVRPAFLLFPDARARQLQVDLQAEPRQSSAAATSPGVKAVPAPPSKPTDSLVKVVEPPQHSEPGPRESSSYFEVRALIGGNLTLGVTPSTTVPMTLGVGYSVGPILLEGLVDIRLQMIPPEFRESTGGTVFIAPSYGLFLGRPFTFGAVTLTPRLGMALGTTPAIRVNCEVTTVEGSQQYACGGEAGEIPVFLSRRVLAPSVAFSMSRRFAAIPLSTTFQVRAQQTVYTFVGSSGITYVPSDPIRTLFDVQVGLTYRR